LHAAIGEGAARAPRKTEQLALAFLRKQACEAQQALKQAARRRRAGRRGEAQARNVRAHRASPRQQVRAEQLPA
jgi:hypothetical protein